MCTSTGYLIHTSYISGRSICVCEPGGLPGFRAIQDLERDQIGGPYYCCTFGSAFQLSVWVPAYLEALPNNITYPHISIPLSIRTYIPHIQVHTHTSSSFVLPPTLPFRVPTTPLRPLPLLLPTLLLELLFLLLCLGLQLQLSYFIPSTAPPPFYLAVATDPFFPNSVPAQRPCSGAFLPRTYSD